VRVMKYFKEGRSKPKMTWLRHEDNLDFEMSTKACRLNSVNMNCRLLKNSRENELKRVSSMCLQVRRRLPYSGVVTGNRVSITHLGSLDVPLFVRHPEGGSECTYKDSRDKQIRVYNRGICVRFDVI
jgi:hypothetical protein